MFRFNNTDEVITGDYVMNNYTNEQEKMKSLAGEHEFQMFNTALPGYYSFIEWPESWELSGFDDVINDMEIK